MYTDKLFRLKNLVSSIISAIDLQDKERFNNEEKIRVGEIRDFLGIMCMPVIHHQRFNELVRPIGSFDLKMLERILKKEDEK